MRNIKSRY